MYWIASSSDARSGANPPSSPTDVASPFDFNNAASAWKTSAHQRSASLKLGAPTGMIMNSCTSTVLAACAPPFNIFVIGTGSLLPFTPPRKRSQVHLLLHVHSQSILQGLHLHLSLIYLLFRLLRSLLHLLHRCLMRLHLSVHHLSLY